MKGYEIFRKIWDETKGGDKFELHPLAQTEFEEKKEKGDENVKKETLEFVLWLREKKGWIFDSLSYSEEQFRKDIEQYLKEFEEERKETQKGNQI